ncbi:hypothetical protein, partial [Caulobacter sp. 17J80-11]|uniref:hypothetical protein n=1 Tax=Caulobacter sp. 17J80-11 TaxID=2763502 RepID=UPI0019B04EFB
AWLGAAAAACAALARLAQANGNPGAVHGLLFGGAWACGALAAPSPDLFVFLARTPRSLRRLLVDFAVAPAAVGLLAGVAAVAVPAVGLAGAAAVVAGVLACGLALAVAHLNQLAYGPVAGPPRLGIYAALAALAASALGPFAVLFVAGGLALLARTAARRRWSAA